MKTEKIEIRKPFHRHAVQTIIQGDSMTHQSHADSCDINRIVAQFDRTGVMPTGRGEGRFADVTGMQGDLTDLYNRANETVQISEQYAEDWTKKEAQKIREKKSKPASPVEQKPANYVPPKPPVNPEID